MTFTILVLDQKGGAGKPAIAVNLVTRSSSAARRCCSSAPAGTGSLRNWNEVNRGSLVPIVGLDRESLAADLPAVTGGYDYAVIDCAPQIYKRSATAVKAADLVLILVQPPHSISGPAVNSSTSSKPGKG